MDNVVLPNLQKNTEYKISSIDHHYDIVKYDKNGLFKRHRDYTWFYAPNMIQMTLLIGLEKGEGASTKIWYPKNYNSEIESKEYNETITPGGMLLFPSDWYHAGLKLTSGKKLLLMAIISLEYNNIHSTLSQNIPDYVYFQSNNGKLFGLSP